MVCIIPKNLTVAAKAKDLFSFIAAEIKAFLDLVLGGGELATRYWSKQEEDEAGVVCGVDDLGVDSLLGMNLRIVEGVSGKRRRQAYPAKQELESSDHRQGQITNSVRLECGATRSCSTPRNQARGGLVRS